MTYLPRALLRGHLPDRRRLAGAIDADDEDDKRFLRRINHKWVSDALQNLFDLGCHNRLDLVGRDRLVVAAVTDRFRNARGDRGSEVRTQQHVLDVVEHRAVELALGHEIGHRGAERTRGALQPARKSAPPALFRCFLSHGGVC